MTRPSFALFLCFLLAANCAGVALAQTPMRATPQIRALLPRARDVTGVGVQIVNAGFGSERELYGGDSGSYPQFFVDYRVTAPDPKTTGGIGHPWAVLKQLRAPDGGLMLIDDSEPVGENLRASSAFVNPAWKSVTAIFDTIVPGAPADISGKSITRYSLVGALPTRENPKTTPNTQLVTPRGTTVILTSIEADYEKNETVYSLDISRPPIAAYASYASNRMDPLTTKVIDDQNRVISRGGESRSFGTRRNQQEKLIFKTLPPADAITATVNFDLAEYVVPQREFYKTLELEVPVAALFAFDAQRLRAQTPEAESMATKIYRAQNAEFSARIERYWSQYANKEDFRAQVYVAPKIAANVNAAEAARTVAEPVMLRLRNAAGQTEESSLESRPAYLGFHSTDNTPTAIGEMFADVSNYRLAVDAQTTVSLDVQSRQRVEYNIDLRDIAIGSDPTQILPPSANNRGLWLQKASWASFETARAIEDATGENIPVIAGSSLILEGVYEPFAPDTELKIYGAATNDIGNEKWSSWSCTDEAVLKTIGSSAVKENATDKTWMIVFSPLQPQDLNLKRVDVRLSATQSGPIQARATLEFPGVNWSSAAAPVK